MNRPNLDAAITYLEDYGFDVVVVHSIDRLARDPYIRQSLEREFLRRGARVEFALGNYEDSPEGEVRKDMDATFRQVGKRKTGLNDVIAENGERLKKVYTLEVERLSDMSWIRMVPEECHSIRNKLTLFA